MPVRSETKVMLKNDETLKYVINDKIIDALNYSKSCKLCKYSSTNDDKVCNQCKYPVLFKLDQRYKDIVSLSIDEFLTTLDIRLILNSK